MSAVRTVWVTFCCKKEITAPTPNGDNEGQLILAEAELEGALKSIEGVLNPLGYSVYLDELVVV